jgi:hypothetical protein
MRTLQIGINTGKVFAFRDEGDIWKLPADNLPFVFSIATSMIE